MVAIERTTAEQLVLAARNVSLPRTVRELFIQAAQTIVEMDKDIAVYEQQITDMKRQQWMEREERVGG